MEYWVKGYQILPRDTLREKKTMKYIRQLSENERFIFIDEIFKYSDGLGLIYAFKTINSRPYFHKLLVNGLKTANPSTILYWLQTCIPKLGFRRTVNILSNHIDDHPAGVEYALYWVERFLKSNKIRTKKEINSVVNLRAKASKVKLFETVYGSKYPEIKSE